MSRTAKLLIFPLFVSQFLFFGFIALHRFVDADEGFYLLASRLVMMHKKPYLDFVYEQAPLLPYVYALWMKLFGITWTSAKLFSALLTALLGSLLYAEVCRQTGKIIVGFSAVMIFAASGLIFGFFPVVKTLSLAVLLLFAAYTLAARICDTSPWWLFAASGVSFALSVATRSYLVVVMPLFLWWIFKNSNPRRRIASLTWFLGGFSFGMLPCLYFFIASPQLFLFNNLSIHGVQTDTGGLVGMWREKLRVLLQTFLGRGEGNGLQTSILFFVSLGLLSPSRKDPSPSRLAFQIAIVIGIVSLLPTLLVGQYFGFCIPFLLLSAVYGANNLVEEMEPGRLRIAAVAACAAVFAVYLAASVPDFRRYLVTGDEVWVELSVDKNEWRLQQILQVSQAIDAIVVPGEPVAGWPGYVFQTKAIPFPGFETDFAIHLANMLTPEQRSRYHVFSPDDIRAEFASHQPRVVVLRDERAAASKGGERWRKILRIQEGFRSSLHEHGYTLVRSIGQTSIYVCCSEY
jgi:hypothetical protein